MPSKPTIAPEELGQLRLEKARALLAQTGSTTTGGTGQSVRELQQLIDELCELSLKDALTGLANRRHFQVVIDRELDRVGRRTGETALLLMVDVDHSSASMTLTVTTLGIWCFRPWPVRSIHACAQWIHWLATAARSSP